jgi:hypothetical protein
LSSSPVSPVERPLPSLAAPRVLALDRLALRMLVGDRLKYLGLVAGLFFASLLVLQQASIFTGYTGRMASWVHDVQGHDLWVTDPQMDFTEDPKHLLPTALGRVRSVDGAHVQELPEGAPRRRHAVQRARDRPGRCEHGWRPARDGRGHA